MTWEKSVRTLAYLLRGWEEGQDGAGGDGAGWRFSLEDPHTGLRRGFASLTELTVALERQTSGHAPPPIEEGPKRHDPFDPPEEA